MARAKGIVKYGLNLEVQTPAPLDARSLVPTKADLTNTETWIVAPSTIAYTYTGMLVVVASDSTETNNGIYMLKNRTGYADIEQWTKLSNETVFSITGMNLLGLYDETPDVVYMKGDVVSIDGALYYCLEDNTANIKPTVTTDWELNWSLFQLKGSQGNNGYTPTIGNNNNWWINGVDQLKKAVATDGLTPRIQDGFWYIGDNKYGRTTGTQITISEDGYWVLDTVKSDTLAVGLQGEAAVANINYLGNYTTGVTYSNNNRNGKIDVVTGSDGTMYAAKATTTVNPVTDTARNFWNVFSMKGNAGTPGHTPYIFEGYWWIDGVQQNVKAAGDVLSISIDGFWEINGTKTDKVAVPTNGSNGTNGTNGENGESAVANINVRGPWESGQNYLHTNLDGTTDVVLGSNGTSYFCLQDTSIDPTTDITNTYWAQFSMAGSPGLTPHIELDPDGEYRWYIGTQNQNIIAKGKNGNNGLNGTNGRQPYISEQGYWGYKLLMPNGTYQYQDTRVLAEGLTPSIKNGYWYLGTRPTGVKAVGESAIANLNYLGEWEAGKPYFHINATASNWTDVVLGADENSYYCKANNTDKNPCKLVGDTWVRDEANAQYWAKFVMKGTAVEGRSIELRKSNDWIQWRIIGDETWINLVELETIKGASNLSDISTPIGMIQMWSGAANQLPEGYLLCDGSEVLKTEYNELVEKLSGGNVDTSAFLPDLQSRFVVGYNENDTDYDTIGKTNNINLKSVTLTAKQSGLPIHEHTFETTSSEGTKKQTAANGNSVQTPYNAKTSLAGGVGAKEAHENRPPYYVLAYVIKASYQGEIRTPYDTYLQTVPAEETPLTKEEWLESLKAVSLFDSITNNGNVYPIVEKTVDIKAYKYDYITTQLQWNDALSNGCIGIYRVGVPVQIEGAYADGAADGEWTIKIEPTAGDLFLLEIRDVAYRAYIGTLTFDETLCTFNAIEQIATKTNHSHDDATKMSKLITETNKTASFTLADADSDVMLSCNHATVPIVVTVPPDLSPGKQFYFTQEGDAAVSFVAGIGMTIKSAEGAVELIAKYAVSQIIIINSTSCRLFGNLI